METEAEDASTGCVSDYLGRGGGRAGPIRKLFPGSPDFLNDFGATFFTESLVEYIRQFFLFTDGESVDCIEEFTKFSHFGHRVSDRVNGLVKIYLNDPKCHV